MLLLRPITCIVVTEAISDRRIIEYLIETDSVCLCSYLPCPYDDFHGAPACSGAIGNADERRPLAGQPDSGTGGDMCGFARVMEYSGLLEETRGKLWRERRFYAGAILRQSIMTIWSRAIERCHRRDHQPIFRLDDQSFLCHASRIQKTDVEERDKLKDYVSTLCTPLFTNATKRSPVSARNCLMSRPSSKQRLDKMLKQPISGRVFRTILRSTCHTQRQHTRHNT